MAFGRCVRLFFYLIIAATLTGTTYLSWRYRSIAIALQKPPETDYARLSNDIVRADADLPIKGSLRNDEAALAVRDFVYRKYDLGPESLPGESPAALYAALRSESSNRMMCGAAGLSYSWALQAIGIPSRFVQLAGKNYLSGKDIYQTHVTVEAWLNGAWEISDPTYNISVACSDEPSKHLSTPQVHACIERSQSLVLIPGKTQIHNITKYGAKIIDPERYASYFAAYTRRQTTVGHKTEAADSFPHKDWLETATQYSQ